MKRLTAIAAFAVLGLALTAPAAVADDTDSEAGETSDLERVSAYVQPSVVYLQMNWKGYIYDKVLKDYLNGGSAFEVSTQCTGYVVNPDGYIATAGHCVDPKGDIEDSLALQGAQWAIEQGLYNPDLITAEELAGVMRVEGFETKNKGPDREVVAAWGVSAGGVQTGKSYNARVVKFQPFDQGDAAVIKVEATDLPAIELADDTALEVGTEIVSIGYPASVDLVADQSFSPSYKDGTISSEKTVQGGQYTVYEISAAVSGGMSGGPTVNLDGDVIGFNSFKIDPAVESQSFNFVRPTSIINEVLADAGVANELGEVSENYYAGLDAYFAGDKDAAVESLQAVVDDQPTNTMAADFLKKAQDLPDEAASDSGGSDDGGGFPIALVGGIGAGVLVLLGLVVFLISRRGKGQGGQGGPSPAMPVGQTPGGDGGWAPQPSAPMTPTTTSSSAAPSGPYVAPATAQAAPAPQAATPPAPVTPPAPAAPTASSTPPAPPAPPSTSERVGFTPTSPEPATEQVEQPHVPEQAHAFCGTCGTRAVAGQKFCGNCGATL